MSDFVTNELKTIELGNGKWIKILSEISYGQAQDISVGDSDQKRAMDALQLFIKEWNLQEEDGKIADITEENIKRMPRTTVELISSEIAEALKLKKQKTEQKN